VISAVVINWNGRHYLEACLTALQAQDPAPDEIILVDNHSDDGSRSFVAERFPAVRVVDTGYNAGPAYARNMGVERAAGDRVLLVDNDVCLQQGALQSLVATMDAHPDTAIVQARSLCADDPQLVHYDASDLHYLGLLVLHNWFEPLARADRPAAPMGGLVALCFLADRRQYLDAGGFNSALFILFEDNDLAWRMRMRGLQIRLDPNALVLHGGGTERISTRDAAASYPSRRVYLHSRNRWLVLLTCMRWRTLAFSLPAQLAYEFVQLAFACVRLHPIAWLQGKLAVIRLLPRVLRWRRQVQAGRTAPDRALLVGGPLTLNPGLADAGAARRLHSLLDWSFTAWWRVFGRFCG